MKVAYDPLTGVITNIITGPVVDASWVPPEWSVADPGPCDSVDKMSKHWVDAGTVVAKAAFPATLSSPTIVANGVSSSTLSGIPISSSLLILDSTGLTTLVATDTFLDITSDEPGVTEIRVSLFPYLTGVYTVTAT